MKIQAHHKGTVASKKKKKAKLQRAMRSLKRQQRMSSGNMSASNYSPLNHLKDAQVCPFCRHGCYSLLDLDFVLFDQ